MESITAQSPALPTESMTVPDISNLSITWPDSTAITSPPPPSLEILEAPKMGSSPKPSAVKVLPILKVPATVLLDHILNHLTCMTVMALLNSGDKNQKKKICEYAGLHARVREVYIIALSSYAVEYDTVGRDSYVACCLARIHKTEHVTISMLIRQPLFFGTNPLGERMHNAINAALHTPDAISVLELWGPLLKKMVASAEDDSNFHKFPAKLVTHFVNYEPNLPGFPRHLWREVTFGALDVLRVGTKEFRAAEKLLNEGLKLPKFWCECLASDGELGKDETAHADEAWDALANWGAKLDERACEQEWEVPWAGNGWLQEAVLKSWKDSTEETEVDQLWVWAKWLVDVRTVMDAVIQGQSCDEVQMYTWEVSDWGMFRDIVGDAAGSLWRNLPEWGRAVAGGGVGHSVWKEWNRAEWDLLEWDETNCDDWDLDRMNEANEQDVVHDTTLADDPNTSTGTTDFEKVGYKLDRMDFSV